MPSDNMLRYYTKKETLYLTHSFHRYPNKLVPQVVNALIKSYSKENGTVLDVFCGSGTSLVEANLLRRNCIGIDVNPLACLISKVKTTRLNVEELKLVVRQLLRDFWHSLEQSGTLADYTNKVSPIIPDFPKKMFWFQEDALISLGILKALIERVEDDAIRNFCLVAFSSIIQKCSNASSLYRLTQRRVQKKIRKTDVFKAFSEKIELMLQTMREYNEKATNSSVKILEGDARNMSLKADFIIANPLSFNFDFVNSFKLYFWWLGFDIKEVEKKVIDLKKGKNLEILGIRLVDELVEGIRKKNHRQAAALSNYYKDMQQAFRSIQESLEGRKYCCVVTSDCKVCKNSISHSKVFIELARKEGLELERKIERIVPKKALRFSNEDKVEEFLILKK